MEKLSWHTERRRVNDLVPYKENPRIINGKEMEDLKRSLDKFNLAEIPAINTDGTVVAGNQRIQALSLLGRGEEEIEVRVPNRPLSEKEFKDYLLTSNRSGGSWDWDKLAVDFDLGELLTAGFDSQDLSNIFDDNLGIEDDDLDEQKEIELAKSTSIKPGDYFALGRHRLLCSDAIDPNSAKKLMGGVRADMVNDDMPFNIGLRYNQNFTGKKRYGGTTNDSKSDSEYRAFVKSIMQNALSVTKPDAHIFFWCDERYIGLLQELYRKLGINHKRVCLWIKGPHNPTPQIAFNKVYEACIYGIRGKPYLSPKVLNLSEVLNKEVDSGNRLIDDILDILNIWLVKRLPGNEYEHPTMKPPTLYEKALRRCTRPGDIVLDLTAGSGSLLVAAEQLRRTAYLCELEPVFCQVVINRFKKISNEKVIKLS